ncbi:pyruvate formate-lyase 2-activating enzyme [Clostridium pasteurianum DSM 525 = ATCC 6013]|uniref:Glycyl-radical enzyme activating protein family n=1 Tax=Clostridium pasteurianum DSM 525 = ATCC 6013 TaxID=1262449 RepID=A0A0H3J4P5_CLOPA|nr:[formate-C-acetyltransferase]-activating enzyme [Clostridium pasteurianum]AJA46913.1 pyruvate formate-lyase 2-activating enzyme [Clostridium pasteurianum DSM 525 = ATCC 6013]AJA50901.1 pyruvate formate-lyase 2-activating enzyme [Clostridium pasteurianum DSM 525 = ATCC 6013]AOZ74297.1 pyruvate formate lyase-activating protein [Clostridium pasteurianum DSM 525 = ATCC 6013]AOZ78095.1 pyruvate formate lyase-activating protein [Clostridium pasteurianum]ELP58163.1 pyruvate formate lyase II activa
MKKALIFNIQRYSLHDGGGIRTVVFFKGCPLKCPWCSNPESQDFKQDIMRKEGLCIKCSSNSCFQCSMKPEDCPTAALDLVGKEYTVKEVLEEVKKDTVFYETTGGGVTLSGGEPLSQGAFALKLLKELKKLGINTAIETTGIGDTKILLQMAKYIDTFLWDFKIMDSDKAKTIVKQDMQLMKKNFQLVMKSGARMIPRLPLIPEYTADRDNIQKVIDFISPFGIKEVHILPFHQYGRSKYRALGKECKLLDLRTLSDEEILEIKDFIESKSIKAVVGGY